jgi:hypothetical protein
MFPAHESVHGSFHRRWWVSGVSKCLLQRSDEIKDENLTAKVNVPEAWNALNLANLLVKALISLCVC